MDQRLLARVSGRVQGVGYRYFAHDVATRLGLTGTVRNLADGGVEVVAEGETVALQALLAHLRQGPAAARVTNVQVSWQAVRGEFREFTIRATGF